MVGRVGAIPSVRHEQTPPSLPCLRCQPPHSLPPSLSLHSLDSCHRTGPPFHGPGAWPHCQKQNCRKRAPSKILGLGRVWAWGVREQRPHPSTHPAAAALPGRTQPSFHLRLNIKWLPTSGTQTAGSLAELAVFVLRWQVWEEVR